MDFPNFFETFPDAAVIEAFSKLRNKRGDEISSNILWYIKLMFDPEHEYISKIPNVRELAVQKEGEVKRDRKSQREKILADYFNVKTIDLNSNLTKEAIKWYIEYWMPPTKRWLNAIGQRVLEAAKVTESFTVSTMQDIITSGETMEAYNLHKKLYDVAIANFNEEKKKKIVGYGKTQVSAAMDGSLFKTNGST